MTEQLLSLGGVATRMCLFIYLLLCLLLLRFNRLILFFFHCKGKTTSSVSCQTDKLCEHTGARQASNISGGIRQTLAHLSTHCDC